MTWFSGEVYSGFQKPEGSALFALRGVIFAGSLESQLIGLFSVRQFFRDWWQGAFSQYIFPNVLMF